jgi:4'-phosphopantetheinyl transferase EntD
MTAAAVVATGRVGLKIVVGGWAVDVATVVPAPGESLSAAARRLAERIVAGRHGLPAGAVRVASLLPSGRPIVSDDSGVMALSVSMAHERGLVGAAVCEGAGVGIDIVDTTVARTGLDHWLVDAELAAASPGMVWAAKEAAYKAAGLDATFRPLRVTIAPSGDGSFSWTLRDDWRSAAGVGRFLEAGRYLLAVACTDTARRSSPGRSEGVEAVPCS